MALYLGIDTSNYTTSTALFDSETGEMRRSQHLLPVKKGQLGLRQSDAVFHHTQQLSNMISSLFTGVNKPLTAVGVSSKPRRAEGSYMPCFSVGVNSAKILGAVLNVPVYEFSHQEGHISAALFSSGRTDLFGKDFISFHISGGTTEGLFVSPLDSRGFTVSLEAKTLDLNAGQAVDRVGLLLGCSFPCGKELEALAVKCSEKVAVKPCIKNGNCCLSGLENQCQKLFEGGKPKEYVANYCLKFIEETISAMTEFMLEIHKGAPVVYAGGVMSDLIIRESLSKKFDCVFAQPEYSCDNAAGIAYLAYRSDIDDKSSI